MFGSSTQLSSWTFKSDQDLEILRKRGNKDYIEKIQSQKSKEECQNFLSADEELQLIHHYVRRLRDFCYQFRDPRDGRIRMPLSVTSTATHYFKRFYLYNSVMDYHPKEIMHTCIYLACKVEEFYVPITDYVYNVEGDEQHKNLTATSILNSELQTTQELQFHLIVHQPYRPVEGLMIDLKTRYPSLQDAESLRGAVDEFLEKVHLTDAILLYAPSQLALAAVTAAASKLSQNLDAYVTDTLFGAAPDMLNKIIDAVRKIKRYVKVSENLCSADELADLERRLSSCRNPLNDPTTEIYAQNQARLEQDDDDFPLVSSTAATEESLMGFDGIISHGADTSVDEQQQVSAKNNNMQSTHNKNSGGSGVLPAHWSADHVDFDAAPLVGGVAGVGLGVHRQVLDGGVIDDDEDDCIMEQ